MTLDDFKSQVAAVLRDAPRCTTADLTDFAVAFWNGRDVVYAYLRDDLSGALDEEFNLSDNEWEQWHDDLVAWIGRPLFSVRPEVNDWIKDAPPNEAG